MKTTRFDGMFVKVWAEPGWDKSERSWWRAARDLEDSIKRHCDCDGTEIHVENEEVCEHCGAPWTEDEPTYNGGCCLLDEERATRPNDGGAA